MKQNIGRLRCVLCGRRGDTIVEVAASFVILLLVIAMFTAAVQFSNRLSLKADRIRADAAAAAAALRDDTPDDTAANGTVTYNISLKGSGVKLFSVDAQLEADTVTYTGSDGNEKTVTFYRYAKEGG